MAAPTRGVKWYTDRIAAITTSIPMQAHALAAQQAAGLAAAAIGGKRSGRLARDISRAKIVSPGRATVGSDLPYARIRHFGGTIEAKPGKKLLIRGVRGGNTRSDTGGDITAAVESVQHPGTHYLDAATRGFPPLYLAALRRMMPKG